MMMTGNDCADSDSDYCHYSIIEIDWWNYDDIETYWLYSYIIGGGIID